MKSRILGKIRSLTWKRWLERPFGAFEASLFKDGLRKEYFKKIGFSGVDCKALLLQDGVWYESPEVWEDMVKKLPHYLKNHSIFDVTKSLDKFHKEKRRHIIALSKKKDKRRDDPRKQLAEIYEILTTNTSFIWMAHGLEEFYKILLHENVPKYVKGEISKFIGDASFPKKKNMHFLMEDAMRRREDPEKIARKFGWLRARDGFSDPFSADDIKNIIKGLKPAKPRQKIRIPAKLKKLMEEMQELVYFRTARTDVFYELLFLSRPILKRVGELYNISFPELKRYSVQSLIEGKPRRYDGNFTLACYENESYIGEEPVLTEEGVNKLDFVKGTIAHKGVTQGAAKIILLVSELDKVKDGDILVTQMTFPNYITAMTRAVAFVTDEGGITCHAAIVAREMKKPGIIGTKIATKIFKDEDIIEVDANKGIVRKIK